MRDDIDVHVLGYFLDPESPGLRTFLAEQRLRRIDRVRPMIARLAALGIHLDADAILRRARDQPGKSIGRPGIARALDRGRLREVDQRSVRQLAVARAARVRRPRRGAARRGVRADSRRRRRRLAGASRAAAARRVDSRASRRPASTRSRCITPNHDEDAARRYRSIADRLGLGVSGGSDYHADESHGSATRAASRCRPRTSISCATARRAARPLPAPALLRRTARRSRRSAVAARPVRADDPATSADGRARAARS